jgi:hypothetical protein
VTQSGAAGPLLQVVGDQQRLYKWEQVTTGDQVGLEAEPVTSDLALQTGREEAVVSADENASPRWPRCEVTHRFEGDRGF